MIKNDVYASYKLHHITPAVIDLEMSPFWLKLIPPSIRSKISHRHNLLSAINNAGWLFADKVVRMGMGVIVGIWVARYLGPEQFGLLNYAIAFATVFAAIASLGLKGIVVRDLVIEPDIANTIMGTAFILQLIGGIASFCVILLVVNISHPNDYFTRLSVVILSFGLIFKASEVIKYYFEAIVKSKYAIWIENGSFLVTSTARVALIVYNAKLILFVWATLIEGVIASLGLLWIYRWHGGNLHTWRFGYLKARKLLQDSWPLILSSLAIIVYMRIDQIMLGQMIGNEAVGLYSAAVRISELWYFIPMAIVASAFPAILKSRSKSEATYSRRLQNLLNMMTVLALGIAIPMTFISNQLVTYLFGPKYADAGIVLAIHIWTGLFVFLGVVAGRWLIAENLQRYSFYRTLGGALINIILNIILIPKYGITGAALATVVSQALASVLFNAVSPITRTIFFMQIKALIGVGLWGRRLASNDH